MKKKIITGSILTVFLMMTISFVSVVGTETSVTEKKESPLYSIRTKSVLGERLGGLKSKLFGERMFFLPFLNNDMGLSIQDGEILFTNVIQCITAITGCIWFPGCFFLCKAIP